MGWCRGCLRWMDGWVDGCVDGKGMSKWWVSWGEIGNKMLSRSLGC